MNDDVTSDLKEETFTLTSMDVIECFEVCFDKELDFPRVILLKNDGLPPSCLLPEYDRDDDELDDPVADESVEDSEEDWSEVDSCLLLLKNLVRFIVETMKPQLKLI